MSRRTSNSGVVWQVVAPWVRWPLRSPARLAMVLVGVTVLVVLASNLSHRGAPSDAGTDALPASESVSASVTATTTASAPTVQPSTPAGGASTAATATGIPTSSAGTASPAAAALPEGAPAAVASRFVTLWARPDQPQPAWSDALAPMTSQAFAQRLTTVLPGNVPAHAVVGAQPAVVTGTQASVVVSTDAGTVRVGLSEAAHMWRVDSIAPEQLTPTGGAGSTIAPAYVPIPTS